MGYDLGKGERAAMYQFDGTVREAEVFGQPLLMDLTVHRRLQFPALQETDKKVTLMNKDSKVTHLGLRNARLPHCSRERRRKLVLVSHKRHLVYVHIQEGLLKNLWMSFDNVETLVFGLGFWVQN